jgi:hypothetical protein
MKSAMECFAYVRAAWDAKGHAGILLQKEMQIPKDRPKVEAITGY